jgi:hypothetical protein
MNWVFRKLTLATWMVAGFVVSGCSGMYKPEYLPEIYISGNTTIKVGGKPFEPNVGPRSAQSMIDAGGVGSKPVAWPVVPKDSCHPDRVHGFEVELSNGKDCLRGNLLLNPVFVHNLVPIKLSSMSTAAYKIHISDDVFNSSSKFLQHEMIQGYKIRVSDPEISRDLGDVMYPTWVLWLEGTACNRPVGQPKLK